MDVPFRPIPRPAKLRTPVIELILRAYIFFGLLVGIPLAAIFGKWGFIGVLFGTTAWLFIVWAVAHFALRQMDPKFYWHCVKRGVDPYFNAPAYLFNTDNEETRVYGLVDNANCPCCGWGIFLEYGRTIPCDNCKAKWDQNKWLAWDENKQQWVELQR